MKITGAGAAARTVAALLIAAASLSVSCKKVENSMQGINPEFISHQFFETWKRKDWNALFRMTHPAFIQKLRLQNLSPADRALDDEALFVREFTRAQSTHPGKVLRSYEILSITAYHSGDTTVWVSALVNGKKRKIPLTLDGLTLKIDLSRIE
jgi:hypothetical protein